MSQESPAVFATTNSDGSAEFTISFADDDHKFSAAPQSESSNAILTYEETLSWRGTIRTSEPDTDVWKMLMQSEEMSEYLDSQDLTGVVREHGKP